MSRIHLKLFSLLRSLSWEQIIKIGNFVNLWDDAGSGHMLLVIDEIELKIFHKHVNEQSISGWSFDTNLIHQTLKKKVSEKLYLKLKRERINYFQHFALTSLNWDSFDTQKKTVSCKLSTLNWSENLSLTLTLNLHGDDADTLLSKLCNGKTCQITWVIFTQGWLRRTQWGKDSIKRRRRNIARIANAVQCLS